MVQSNPTFLESLASRYNLAASPDWQPVIRHFELGQGFAFIVLLVPNDDWAEICKRELDGFLRGRGEHVMQVPVTAPDDLKQLAGTLLELQPETGAGAIWVAHAVPEALPDYPVWSAAWREGVARLNQFRNPLRRQFKIPLIFVGAPWLQVVLRENAPDLWSVRTLVARVSPEFGEPEFRLERSGLDAGPKVAGPDPEFALAEANRLRGKPGAELAVARLLYRAGTGFAARLQWSDAVQAFSESLEIRKRVCAPPEDVADARYQQAIALTRLSKDALATVALTEARSEYEEAGNLLGSARSIHALGVVALRSTDPRAARERYQEALDIFRRLGDVEGEATCLAGLGSFAMLTGDYSGARARYEQALLLFRRIKNNHGEAHCVLGLGDVAFQGVDFQTASACYRESLNLFRKVRDIAGEANCLARLARATLYGGDIEVARGRFAEARTLFRSLGDTLGEANCLAGFGNIALVQNDRPSAIEHYRAAIRLFKQASHMGTVGRLLRLMAQNSDGEERKQYLAEARSAFKDAGRPDLADALDQEFPAAALTSSTPPADAPR